MNPLERLEALKTKYYHELPEKMSNIQVLFDLGVDKSFDAELWEKLLRYVHNLSGSGATFGLVEVSTAARALENALKPFVLEERSPSENESNALNILLESLLSACQLDTDELNIKGNQNLIFPVYDTKEKEKHASIIIYLIDDDPDVHDELEMQLKGFGYKVESFLDTQSFEKTVKLKAPDVVLMDVMFPEGREEGIESIHRLQKQMLQPFTLLFMSSKDDFVARANAVKAGSDGFIIKPIIVAKLIEKIDLLTEQTPTEAIRVLILDDEVNVAEFHASLLNAAGIDTLCINNPEQVLDTMALYRPDLLLIDFHMPGYNGLEVAKVIRQMDEYFSIPIIYLSAERDESLQNKAINVGAEDFMLKPVGPEELCKRIINKAERYKNLRMKIQQDSLTGLYNHTAITDLLTKTIADAKRYKYALSFAMIDIDYFKNVNDTYGHQAGDTVLKVLSSLLLKRVRTSDMVGRYGGEEFCLILPHATIDEAEALMNQIRIKFKEIAHIWDSKEFHTTFSCGVCQWNEKYDTESLIEHADKFMYQAKRSGRDKVVRCN